MGKDLDLLHAVKTNDVGTVRKIIGKIWSSKSSKFNFKYLRLKPYSALISKILALYLYL